ncbi:MAG: sigma-70 family RNA polymerase sigma factor [Rhodoglobus sp.]
MTPPLEEDFVRHEFGRLVAMLSRRAGVQHLDAIEDAVQAALLAAVQSWPERGAPENRSAWLFSVARNHVVGELRRRARQGAIAAEQASAALDSMEDDSGVLLGGDLRDDLLRILFVCCDDALPIESQLVLALKTLCGFDVREIAERLFMTEANVYKRLGRARSRLREAWTGSMEPTSEQLASRLPGVLAILYVLFTEGYLSSHAEGAIRRVLCDEARRLTEVLAEHPLGATPETFALLALMHFHLARMPARQDGSGGLLLLEEQDRSRWDQAEIERGLSWLARSAEGSVFSRYHAEAGIAAEHGLAASFAEVRWDRIVDSYALLERVAPSPLHTLNRALAMAEWRGPADGLAVIEGLDPPSWLIGSYLWSAVLSDLHRRCGHVALAARYRSVALATAPSDAVRVALERRLRAP